MKPAHPRGSPSLLDDTDELLCCPDVMEEFVREVNERRRLFPVTAICSAR